VRTTQLSLASRARQMSEGILSRCGRHSARRAVIGSRREACHAGATHAAVATRSSIPATQTNTAGSNGFIPYNMERINCAAAIPPKRPMASPIKAGRSPSKSVSLSTSSRCAPSAMRMPREETGDSFYAGIPGGFNSMLMVGNIVNPLRPRIVKRQRSTCAPG